MKRWKIVASVAGALVLAVSGILLTEAISDRPDVGEFDRAAAKRVSKLCGRRTDCQVRMADLTDAKWDNFYEWTDAYTADQVSKVTGSPYHPTHENGRVIVLMQGKQVVFQGTGDEGIEEAIAGEVFITCKVHSESFTTCKPDALMRVRIFEARGDSARGIAWPGTSYELTQIN